MTDSAFIQIAFFEFTHWIYLGIGLCTCRVLSSRISATFTDGVHEHLRDGWIGHFTINLFYFTIQTVHKMYLTARISVLPLFLFIRPDNIYANKIRSWERCRY